MNIDKFGLGRWWPRPDQAAAGDLDRLAIDQWPTLAKRWLAAGFDSPLLRRFAEFRPQDMAAAMAALDLMREAMRSIGFDPAPADEEFAARCQSALDIVQHDLDVTGYGRYRMRASLGRGWPAAMFATLPDGSSWNDGGGMTRRGTRRPHRRGGVVAVHQHGPSTCARRPAHRQDRPNASTRCGSGLTGRATVRRQGRH